MCQKPTYVLIPKFINQVYLPIYPRYWIENAPDLVPLLVPTRGKKAGLSLTAEDSEDEIPLRQPRTAHARSEHGSEDYFMPALDNAPSSSTVRLPEDVVEEMVNYKIVQVTKAHEQSGRIFSKEPSTALQYERCRGHVSFRQETLMEAIR
jgi:hypothetical protein